MLLRKSPKLTVDGIVLKKGRILLIKRATQPFVDYWALPGGFVELNETTEMAVEREIHEETNLTTKTKKLVGVYSNPKRDPRRHTITIAYLLETINGTAKKTEEAKEVKYFAFDNLPQNIAFDHRKIIMDAEKIYHKELKSCDSV